MARRLPTDSKVPHVAILDICENLAAPECMGATSTVPDFRPFWGEILHTEQDHQIYNVADLSTTNAFSRR